jgi:hypothetical protein
LGPEDGRYEALSAARDALDQKADEVLERLTASRSLQEDRYLEGVRALDQIIAREERAEIRETASTVLARPQLADRRLDLTLEQRENAGRIVETFRQARDAWSATFVGPKGQKTPAAELSAGDRQERRQRRHELRRAADRVLADPAARRVALDQRLFRQAQRHSTAQRSAELEEIARRRMERITTHVTPRSGSEANTSRAPDLEHARKAAAAALERRQARPTIEPTSAASEQARAQVAEFMKTLGIWRAQSADKATSGLEPSEEQKAARQTLRTSLRQQADRIAANPVARQIARQEKISATVERHTSSRLAAEREEVTRRRQEMLARMRSVAAQPALTTQGARAEPKPLTTAQRAWLKGLDSTPRSRTPSDSGSRNRNRDDGLER